MTENPIERTAQWLKSLIENYGSVDWQFAMDAAHNATGADLDQVYKAYWFGYNNGWFERHQFPKDQTISLREGSGVPLSETRGPMYEV